MRFARLKRFLLLMNFWGLDPLKLYRSLRGFPTFLHEYRIFKRQLQQATDSFPLGKLYSCLEDKNSQSGTTSGHYFHQDLLVARKIFQHHPKKHVDIGSRVDGFVAHVACFRNIEVLDIRH